MNINKITLATFIGCLVINATSVEATEYPKIQEYSTGQGEGLSWCYFKNDMECIKKHYQKFEARQEAFNQKQYGEDFNRSVDEYLEMQIYSNESRGRY